MFLFRWIKNLIIFVLVIAGILYILDHQWNGKTAKEYVTDLYKKGTFSEAFKDISTWVGSIFTAGKSITSGGEDKLTNKDKEKLESLIKNELKFNIDKLKEESVKKEEETKK